MGRWCVGFFFFKQKTAYEMRISDWSSDVCSSDLDRVAHRDRRIGLGAEQILERVAARAEGRVDHRINQPRERRVCRLPIGGVDEGVDLIDRKSVVWGKSVSVRVALGCRGSFKQKNTYQITTNLNTNTKHKK